MRVLFLLVILALVACGGGNSSQPSGGPLPPITVAFTALVTAHNEIEPNNSIATANAQTLPAHGANADYVGFGVIGTVKDATDPADYFLFTASRAHDFTIRLCPTICTQFDAISIIDTSVAYFEVLDQSGTLLLSSQGDSAAGNFQEVGIDAGVAYYLGVFAEDTVGVTQSYYIEMVEKLPVP